MSYPPPPGSNEQSNSGRNTPANHGQQYGAVYSGFTPRAVASAAPHTSAAPASASHAYNYSAPANTYDMSYGQYSTAGAAQPQYPTAYPAAGGYNQYNQQYGQYNNQYAGYAQSPPQIRNPFAPPPQSRTGGQNGNSNNNNNFDPEWEAQVQQWQSAYASRDDNANNKGYGKGGSRDGATAAGNPNTTPLGGRAAPLNNSEISAAANSKTDVASVVTDASGQHKTVVRTGGGAKWEDPTLLQWNPEGFRVFCGNLAGEVTDESLLKAFSRWPSVTKAHVVRDKRTTKSKGYGFVEFMDGDEFFQAAKEMQGKYVGSHPILIRRSETNIKPVNVRDKNKNNKYNKNQVGEVTLDTGCTIMLTHLQDKKGDEALRANTGGGVQKKQGNKQQQQGKFKVLG